jgi:Cell division protein FtsI/penicillin-binding protein 2
MAFGFKSGSRISIVATLMFIGIAIITIQLFQLQIVDHNKYSLMADDEHIKQLIIPARRGKIYALDRGSPSELVMNSSVYTVFLDPFVIAESKNSEKVEQVINGIAGGNIVASISDAINKKDSRYQIVAKRLSRQQAEMIKKESLSGVGFHEETERVYIENGLASQILGYVDKNGDGQYGVESTFDEKLKGKDGLLQTVTDVNMVPLTIGDRNISKPATNGSDIVLTIDKNVQLYAERALQSGLKKIKANKGSVIVMDPNNGQIMAMANYPTYDVAKYTQNRDTKNFKIDMALFNNPVLIDPYDPGSVIKPFTLSIGLDKGVITPSSTYYNKDYIIVDDITINNAVRGWIGEIDMQKVLDYSLNTGVVTVAQRLGDGKYITRSARNTMYDYYFNKYGFGRATGIELYESSGQVISPDEVQGNAVRYSNMAFGQGMSLTMLQVASGFCTIVNGGQHFTPSILAGEIENEQFVPKEDAIGEQVINKNTSSDIRKMLIKARSVMFSVKDREGYMVGGKTGTSETIIDGSYSKDVTIASYLGFGGDSSPKYVIMVRVQGDGMDLEGSTSAEPIFTDISNWMIQYLNLKPRG